MRDTFIETLCQLAENDPRIMLITGDLGFKVFDNYRARFPRQFINAGVAEQNMTGLAAGLALEGRTVFTYSIGNFSTLRCLEQIRNDACYHGAAVKVVSVGGGFSYGALGISHHATEDLAVMRSLPDITVVAPCDLTETAAAAEAIAAAPGTCYLRLDKSAARPTSLDPPDRFRLGKARLIREGTDITFIGCGGIVAEVQEAADRLAIHGIQSRILSMHTVKPLDTRSIVLAASQTGGIVTVEEHTVDAGLGSAVAETLMDAGLMPHFFRRIGLRAGFSSIVGSQQYLRRQYELDAQSIYSVAARLVLKSNAQSTPVTRRLAS